MDSWPDRNQLTAVYNAACDYWNLAAGSPMEEVQKLDFEQLRKRSGLPHRLVWSSVRVLDQLGVLKLSRSDEPQVGLRFHLSDDGLRDRMDRMNKPRKKEFTDRLYRMTGPESTHRMVYMDERLIINRLQTTSRMLENGLKVLSDEGILAYSLVRNEPMARLLEPRYQKFSLSEDEILRHRDRLLKKLDYMIGYVKTKSCRSRYIRIYFGEKDVPERCGKCDNCRKKDSGRIEIEDIRKVESLLKEKPMAFTTLQDHTQWGRKRLKSVLACMLRDEIVRKVREEGEQYTID